MKVSWKFCYSASNLFSRPGSGEVLQAFRNFHIFQGSLRAVDRVGHFKSSVCWLKGLYLGNETALLTYADLSL